MHGHSHSHTPKSVKLRVRKNPFLRESGGKGSKDFIHKLQKVARAVKQARSRTATLQKRKPRFFSADDLHSGKTKNRVTIWLHKASRGPKPQTMMYMQQNSGYFANPPSKQIIVSIAQDLAVAQIQGETYSNNTAPKFDTYVDPLFLMNPFKRDTTNVLTGGAGGNANLMTSMYIKSVTYEFQFANQSNYAADVILYCLTPRKTGANVGFSNAGKNTSGSADQTNGSSPVNTWINSFNSQLGTELPLGVQGVDAGGVFSGATAGYPTANTHGNTPFMYASFRKSFKGLYKREINLAAGAVHKFEVVVHVNKWVKETEVNSATYANQFGIPGLTLDWEMIVRGSPGVLQTDGVNNQVADQDCTITQVGIAYTVVRRITYGFKQTTESDMHVVAPTFYAPSTSGGHVSNIKILNIVDTAVTNAVV